MEVKDRPYQVYIMVNDKRKYAGGFTTFKSATLARRLAQIRYYGNFKRKG